MTVPKNRRAKLVVAGSTSPAEVRNNSDPGDTTQRNFRYQHAYGVILIVGARLGVKPYVVLYCEHHEDFLAERSDGKFDGYQVKTSRPELGPWRITDEKIVKSLGRFVELVEVFGDFIGSLFIVSNTSFELCGAASHDEKKKAKCPAAFLLHVKACKSVAALESPFSSTFKSLAASVGTSPETLLQVLHRVDLIQGPSRADFDVVVSHQHLGKLPECEHFNSAQLDVLRDKLIGRISLASSQQVTDVRVHLSSIFAKGDDDPVILAKKLLIAELDFETASAPFSFLGDSSLTMSDSLTAGGKANAKFAKGGLEDPQIEVLLDRGLAAERHLLEDLQKRPNIYPSLLRQLEGMVLGECQEAYLRCYKEGEYFGREMLIDVQDRLRELARDRPHMIGFKEYECLVGIATLLTDACKVWWSKRFQIDSKGVTQ